MRYEVDPALDAQLRGRLTRLWADVTNAGGAVGFVPPVTVDDVRPTADDAFDRVTDGRSHLVVAFDGGDPRGFGLLEPRPGPLFSHWTWVKRLQVAPELQGRGLGAGLLHHVHRAAADLGLEQTRVTVRGGTGLEAFYERYGYRVVARIPGTIRLPAGEDRDELVLVRDLDGSSGPPGRTVA